MAGRICPECETRTEDEQCPRCGIRTIRELPAGGVRDPLIGELMDGRYRIESLIGRGGMGAVYRAVDTTMNRVVAVKVIRSDGTGDMKLVKRFHREARAATLLTHPHTVKVFDFGQAEDGNLYMVMEFLAGRTLSKAVKTDGRFAPERAVKVLTEIARSLGEAHERGLVHRDLKPDNVVLVDVFGDPDFVKVLDFGIAKFLTTTDGSNMTATGMVVGTPHYMAPEVAGAPGSVTQATDIYALGVILFEMLSGEKPFKGDTPMAILAAHQNEPAPALPSGIGAPPEIAALLRSMLSKDPAGRPSIVDCLRACSGGRPGWTGESAAPATHPVTPARGGPYTTGLFVDISRMKKALPYVAAASAAGLFALLAVLWWPEPESAREVMPPPPAPARQRDVQPAPPVPARVESRLARLVLTSTPAGAMVHKGNQFLCNTPCDIEMAATGDAEMLRLRLKGHQDAAVEVPLMPGLAVRREVRLEALPVKSPGRGGARPEAPARPRGGTPPRDDLPGLRLDEAGGK